MIDFDFFNIFYNEIPAKDIKAIAIKPVIIKVIPSPLNCGGML